MDKEEKNNSLVVWNGMVGSGLSGGDKVTQKLIESKNMQFDLLTSKNTINILKIKNKGSIYLTEYIKKGNIFYLAFFYLFRIIQSMFYSLGSDKNYKTIISSSPFIFDVLPSALFNSKNKVVFLFHVIPQRESSSFSSGVRYTLANIERKMSYFIIRKKFDLIFTGNVIEKKKLRKIFPKIQICVVDAGLEVNKLDKFPAEKKDKNLAFFVGRIVRQKGVFDLVEIIEGISKTNKNIKLIIAGEGPDSQELIETIKRNKLQDKIKCIGPISDKDKIRLLKQSSYFFFPSYEEGWGIALAEALYCNDLCFCYELPHYKSIFGDFPVYVKKGDISDFVMKFKENKYKKVKKEQKSFIKKYDEDKVIKEAAKFI